MSYILDALKKNQAEQQPADTLAVNIAPPQRTPRWLITLLVVVAALLLVNAGFFTLQFFQSDDAPATASTPAEPHKAQTPTQTAAATQPAEPVRRPPPPADEPMRTIAPATSRPEVSQARPRGGVIVEPDPIPAAQTTTSGTIERVDVAALSSSERLVYDDLNFTSHIYTDNPDDCAIVVDGFRLGVGDGFKGLQVAEITEEGVVFAERRGGVERHVVISILERWANEG